MTVQEVIALIALLASVAGMVGGVWLVLAKRIGQVNKDAAAAIAAGDAELHARINKTRDEYVRRDDLMQHIQRIEAGQAAMMAGMTAGFDRVNQRIDGLADRRPAAAGHEGG